MTCTPHHFSFDIKVIEHPDMPGNASLEITGQCTECGVPIVWLGQRGAGADYPVCSVDRRELRAPVTLGYDVEIKPRITALINGEEIVPRGRTS